MPVHCYYGDEAYLLQQAVAALRRDLISPDMAALSHKVLSKPSIPQTLEAVGAVTFSLGGNTLLELHAFEPLEHTPDTDTEKKQLDALKALLESLEPTRHVLFVSPRIDRKMRFAKWLAAHKAFDVRPFKPFAFWETDKAVTMLIQLAKAQDIALMPQSATMLVDNFGVSMQPLLNEVAKLAVYALNRPIQPADVALLSANHENTFRMLDDWLCERNRAGVFETLDTLLLREHPIKLLGLTQSILNKVVRLRMLQQQGCPVGEIAEQLKKKPFSVSKDLKTYGRIPYERLVYLKDRAMVLEWQSKTGQLSPQLAYELLLSS